jgi:hypothetical protein
VPLIRVERSHVFETSLERGFAVITDPANWPSFWPGLVRIAPESRWAAPGDEARLVLRLLGRDVELRMTVDQFLPNRLVTYTSAQQGLPDARHERHFRRAGDGFEFRIVVVYEPRAGRRGILDRSIVRRGVDRAVRQTLRNLEDLLASG